MIPAAPTPLALIAELTHRCPLHCVYCSNPLELQHRAEELSTEVWARVFREAAEAEILQGDFTGGEPPARPPAGRPAAGSGARAARTSARHSPRGAACSPGHTPHGRQ